jgi:hypothetical protein
MLYVFPSNDLHDIFQSSRDFLKTESDVPGQKDHTFLKLCRPATSVKLIVIKNVVDSKGEIRLNVSR